jgi:hypothetical protein
MPSLAAYTTPLPDPQPRSPRLFRYSGVLSRRLTPRADRKARVAAVFAVNLVKLIDR